MSDKWMLDLIFPKYGYIRKDVFGNGRLSAGIRYEVNCSLPIRNKLVLWIPTHTTETRLELN